MKIGISTATLFNRVTTEESFEVIKSLGFDIVEVFLTTFCEYKKEYIDALAIERRKRGLEVYSVHSLNQQFEPELYNKNPRTYEGAEHFYKKLCYAAGELGAKYYTFHGPALLKRTPYHFDFKHLGERTQKLCDILAEYGAELAYENVHWTFFSTPEYFSTLKEYVPNLKACLDIKQAMQSKIPYRDYLAAMGDRLVNVHICDYDDNGKLAIPGRGTFDFKTFFKVLCDIGYNGPVMLELYGNDFDTYDDIKESVEYLRSL